MFIATCNILIVIHVLYMANGNYMHALFELHQAPGSAPAVSPEGKDGPLVINWYSRQRAGPPLGVAVSTRAAIWLRSTRKKSSDIYMHSFIMVILCLGLLDLNNAKSRAAFRPANTGNVWLNVCPFGCSQWTFAERKQMTNRRVCFRAFAKANKDGGAHSLFHNGKVPYIAQRMGDKWSIGRYY